MGTRPAGRRPSAVQPTTDHYKDSHCFMSFTNSGIFILIHNPYVKVFVKLRHFTYGLNVFIDIHSFFYLLAVPAGSPSRGGDVKVCVFDINQSCLPTPFTLFFCLFLSYGPFTCISFHKFPRQLSVFSLCCF